MRTGYYHSNPPGRVWYILAHGEERPTVGEPISVSKRKGGTDVVRVREVIEQRPDGWICRFERGIGQAQAPSRTQAPQQSPVATSSIDPFADPDLDGGPMLPGEQPAMAPQAASTDPRLAALQALLGGVDEAKILAQVNAKVDATLRPVVQGLLASVPETVRKVALEVLAQAQRLEIVVTTPQADGTSTSVNLGEQHQAFPRLLRYLQTGMNVWTAGPAGTGKTTAARMAANALGRPFYFNGAIDTEYKLSGFIDAQGRVISTAFRKAWEQGGVYLFDECDASLPPALLAFNAALANSHADFPDGVVERHPNFLCIAAANTWGMGADFEYVGRNKLDAAFLDRFVFLSWDIDERLESSLAANPQWVQRVRQVRAQAKAKGVKVVISPRASIFGAKLLANNVAWEEVEAITLRKGLNASQWEQIK